MSRFSASSRANFPRIVNVFSPLHQITPVGATIRGPATTTNPVCGEGHLARRTSVSSAGLLHCSLRPELLVWGACPQSNGPNLAGNCQHVQAARHAKVDHAPSWHRQKAVDPRFHWAKKRPRGSVVKQALPGGPSVLDPGHGTALSFSGIPILT